MKPRWMRYRSSKWFEMMMLEAAIRWATLDACPWCLVAQSEEGCSGCVLDSRKNCPTVTFKKVYGVTWRQAYPEIARVVRKV